MNSFLEKSFQVFAGAIPMVLVWFLGCLYADGIIYWVEEVLPNLWFNFLWLVPISISILLIVYAKMAKKYDKNWMYWSAFVVAILPLSMILLVKLCSNDSNIFAYLFGIILMPFLLLGGLCFEYFEIVFYEIADGFLGFFMCPILMFILIISIIVSLVIFLKNEPGDEQAIDNEDYETDK